MQLSQRSSREGVHSFKTSHTEPSQHHDDKRHASTMHKGICYQQQDRVYQAHAKLLPLYLVFVPVCVFCTLLRTKWLIKSRQDRCTAGKPILQSRGCSGNNAGPGEAAGTSFCFGSRLLILILCVAGCFRFFPLTYWRQPVKRQLKTEMYTQKTSLLCTQAYRLIQFSLYIYTHLYGTKKIIIFIVFSNVVNIAFQEFVWSRVAQVLF